MPHIDGSQAGDLAVTAAEGGIGYWCQIDEYKPSRWFTDKSSNRPDNVPDDFVFYTIARLNDNEDGYDWDNPMNVTPVVLNRGLRLFVEQDFHTYGFDPFDIETADSDAADVIVQLGLFGKLIYG